MIKEPWPGCAEWDREAKKIQRETERSTAAFREFCFVLCLGAGLFGVLALLALVSRLGADMLPMAIIGSVIIWFGVRAAGYWYGVFKREHEDE